MTCEQRILEISYKYKLSHVGSCLAALPAIEWIYDTKKPNDLFVLSSGHAGLALYVVLEKHGLGDAEEIWKHHGTHPDYCPACHLDCSTGSLGHGVPIACGMAMADRTRDVWCVFSDGESREGSIWEALRIKDKEHLDNLHLHLIFNGWGAYDPVSWTEVYDFEQRGVTVWKYTPVFGFDGQAAHYKTVSKGAYGLCQ